jgi:Spy/CpxP family protein refolding chaperone
MKNLIITALLVIGLSAFAQESKEKPSRSEMEKLTPEQRAEKHLKKLTSDLNLNEKQQEEVKKIIAEQSVKRESLKTERKERQTQMKEERTALHEKMKTILTPEQFEKWSANNEKMKAKVKERMHQIRE